MPRQLTSATAKFASETDFFTVQFTLLSGEIISGSACSISVSWGVDSNPSVMLANSPSVTDDEVTFALQSGIAGNIYKVSIEVTTSLGRALTNQLLIEVC